MRKNLEQLKYIDFSELEKKKNIYICYFLCLQTFLFNIDACIYKVCV